jgi:hypothetical protein
MIDMKLSLRFLFIAAAISSTAMVAGCGSDKVTKTTTTEETVTAPAAVPAPPVSTTTTTTTREVQP